MPEETIKQARREVIMGCQEIAQKGFVLGAAGNVSARIGDSRSFIITPSGGNLERLSEDSLVMMNENGVVYGSLKQSSEWMIHAKIYQERPDVGAVIHTHSPCATAVSSLEGVLTLPIIDIEMVLHMGGEIGIAPFEIPGTEKLAVSAVDGLSEKMCVLLRHHGDVCVGKDIKQALNSCFNAERSCEMFLKILATGKNVSDIPSDYLTLAKKIFMQRKANKV